MKDAKKRLMDCNECQDFAVGCEENCLYDFPAEKGERPSRLATREAMELEKNNRLPKAEVKLASTISEERQLYSKADYKKLNSPRVSKRRKKEISARNAKITAKRVKCQKQVIKETERQERRREKNRKK